MTETDAGLPDDAIEFAHQLFEGARSGNVSFVSSAIQQGVPIDLSDEKGNTLLMLAAYHGHAALVERLAEMGADLNRQNDRGQTPLAGAVFKRYTDVITLLMKHGADIDAGTPSARATAQMFEVSLSPAATDS